LKNEDVLDSGIITSIAEHEQRLRIENEQLKTQMRLLAEQNEQLTQRNQELEMILRQFQAMKDICLNAMLLGPNIRVE